MRLSVRLWAQQNANSYIGDKWTNLAKKRGYPARSVFKLEEIQKKHSVFRKSDDVLDLGASPGSWTLYASQQVGSGGRVLGIDLKPPTVKFPTNVSFLEQDVMTWPAPDQPVLPFDVIISDMAPNTCGDKGTDAESSYDLCVRAVNLSQKLLRPKGTLLVKLLQGIEMKLLTEKLKTLFSSVHVIVPVVTRKHSNEVFVLGKNFLNSRHPAGPPKKHGFKTVGIPQN